MEEEKEPRYIDKLIKIVESEIDELSGEELIKAFGEDCSEEVKELSHKINNSQAKSNKTPGCKLS
jgi:predicted Ser/Thr protein kinase